MRWHKIGCIFCPDNISTYMKSYARIPIVDFIQDNLYTVYFASRDDTNRERVFRAILDMSSFKIIDVDINPVLDFGENLGAFDDNGVTPCCIVNTNGRKLLYYCGWNIHVKIPFTCAIGLAESFDGGKTFVKLFKGAVLDRDRIDNQFVAVNDVLVDSGIFKTWYLSCIEWRVNNLGKPIHYYYIHYAESTDGINWRRYQHPAIGFKNKFEYAISTPRVVKDGQENYKMWYSYRAQENIKTYRIGYATSTDALHWNRKDEEMNSFDVSPAGWDSEMICYPFIFDHNGNRYMLYNGNKYGLTGFGLAVLESA